MPYQPTPDTSYYEFSSALPEIRAATATANKPFAAAQLQAPPRPPQATFAGTPSGYGVAQLQPAAAPGGYGASQPRYSQPGEITQAWKLRWQEYLQQQAARQQQLAQALHGLGPYGNALTLPQIGDAVNARRQTVMQYLLGAGPRSFGGPGQ